MFQYSGHGAQQTTLHPAIEKDGLDEIICPYDFNDTAATAISDKKFAQRFAKIPKDVHFVWISDSCHAADLSRDPAVNNDAAGIRFRNFKGVQASLSNVQAKESTLQGALLSGCASHQLSADAFINNRFNGAFTHYLIKNLGLYGHNTNMQNIIQYVNQDLADNGYDQNPKIEGALSQATFFKQ